MRLSGNTILRTGGGSGIGRALAQEFHALGNQVIITGRNQAKLDAVCKETPGIIGYSLDVDDPDAIARVTARIIQEHPNLNVLFNNAGVMHRQELAEDALDVAVSESTVVTNFLGPLRLTGALLPHLSKQPAAAIINVTSGLATVPLANTPTYCATKAAMHCWTQALRHKMRGQNIEVIELIPPAVQTELTPGQSAFEGYMPLEDFIAETMDLFRQEPTPGEICVERAKFLRNAERENRFDTTIEQLNANAP